MILKKPYAFIIKHFRIIHLIALIPMIYLLIRTRGIVSFFAEYVRNGYTLSGNIMLANLSASYINWFMYLAVFVILIIFLILAFILQYKNKPTRFYNISILYYFGIFILISLGLVIFQSIEADTLDNTLARVIRDLIYIIHYSEYIFIIFTAVRGVGFNIKKFDFKGDIEDLQISSEDNEEFEFLVGKDSYKTKRTIRRFLREFTYYYKENKFIFTIIIIIMIGILGTTIYTKKAVYQREYSINENIAFSYFNFKVLNAYMTNLDMKGNVLKEGKKYLIIEAQVTNRTRDAHVLSYGNLQLVINKLRIPPNLNIANNFQDFGRPFSGTLIKGNTDDSYIFVYEMDEDLISNNYYLEVYSGYDGAIGGIGALTKNVKLVPNMINSNVLSNKVNLGTNIKIDNKQLGDSEVNIVDYSFTNRFTYLQGGIIKELYIDVTKDINQTLMVLNYELKLDENSSYMKVNKSFKSFFEDFMTIKYTYDGTDYYSKVSLLNPANYKDRLVFKINNNITNATNIYAIITVRNIAYEIKLK